MALDALEEANAAAEFGPVRRNWATRLALGYLASLPPGRWNSSDDVFRAFWRALADDCTPARTRALGRAIEQIHARAGVKRDADRASFFRDRERAFVRERTTQEARIDADR